MGDQSTRVVSSFASPDVAQRVEIKHAFYSLFGTSSILADRRSPSNLALISPGVYLLNMMSLVMPTRYALQDISVAQWFLTALNCMRYDGFAWNFGLQYAVGLVTCLCILVAACAAAGLTYINFTERNVNDKLLAVIRSALVVQQLVAFREALFVPTLCMLISMVKYGLFDFTKAEYVTPSTDNLGPLHAACAFIGLPLFILEVFISIRTTYDFSFQTPKFQWFARSHSFVHNRVMIVVIAQCIFLYSHDSSTPQMYLGFSFVTSLYLAYLHISYLPYYNDRANTLYIAMYAFLANCSVASLFAIHTNSGNVIVLTSFVMFPCYLIISHEIVQRRMLSCEGKEVKNCKMPYECINLAKVLLRKLEICESEADKERIKERLKSALCEVGTEFPTFKLGNVWESLYYFLIEGNASLAQLKLCKHSNLPVSLEAGFIAYHMSKHYDTTIHSEDVLYLNWLKQVSEAKENDRRLCNLLVSIYDLLLSSQHDVNAIEHLLPRMYQLLLKTKETYKHLVHLHSKRPEILELYGHFMCDVLNDMAGLQFIAFSRSEKLVNDRAFVPINRITSLFNADVGILVIGGSEDDLGCIVHANDEASRLLGLPQHEVIGQPLDQFIPPPYYINHNSKLSEFLELGTTNRIFRSHLVLYSAGSYNVEVTYEVRVLALNSRPYFLTAVRGKPGNRDLAIYNNKGLITSCTLNFNQLYGPEARVEGLNLEVLFPGIWEERDNYPDFVPFMLKDLDGSTLYLMFTHAALRLSKVKFVYVIRTVQALEELLEDKVIPPEFESWITSIKEKLEGSDMTAKKAGVSAGMISKVYFDRNQMGPSQPITLESQAQQDLNMTSITSAQSEVRMNNFRSLRDGTQQRAKRINRVLAISFLIVLGIMVGLTIASNYFLNSIVNIDDILDITSRQVLSVNLATEARTLRLIDLGASDDSRENTVARVEAVIEELHSAEETTDGVRNSKGYDIGKDQLVPIWKWQPEITQNLVTGSEAVKQLLSQAEQLTASAPDEAVLYGLRNGVGETQLFLNKTIIDYVSKEAKSRLDLVVLVAVLMSSGIVLILVVYVVILIPQIYFLEQANRKIYDSFSQIHKENIIEARQKVLERLEIVHGEELQDFERDKRISSKYKQIWPKLALKFGLFVGTTTIIIVASVLIFSANLAGLVESNPFYAAWAGSRLTAIQSAYFWSRELLVNMAGTDTGYFDLIAKDQLYYSYSERITNSTADLQWSHKVLTQCVNSAGITSSASSESVKLLYDAYNSPSIELSLGIHSGIQEFISQVHSFTASPTQESLRSIEQLSQSLDVALKELTDDHVNFIAGEVSRTRLALVLMVVAYAVALGLLYSYYARVIEHICTLIIATARLPPLIPDSRSTDLEDKQG
jgi:hypothetical protein